MTATATSVGTLRTGAGPGLRTAVLAHLCIKLLGVATVAGWALATGLRTPLGALTGTGDAQWYLALAEHGYGADPGVYPQSDYDPRAFFPLYPLLVKAAAAVLPTGLPVSALLVSWGAGLLTAVALFRIGALLYGPRAGVALAVAWSVLPHAVVESMAYTESLFTACAAWSLYAVLVARWTPAAALAIAAGLTRPTGIAVVAAVCVAAAVAAHKELVAGRGVSWRPVYALLSAPAGWAGYVLWAGFDSGQGPLGYFDVQRAWGSEYDFGAGSLALVLAQLGAGNWIAGLGLLAAGALLVLLVVLGVRGRQPLPLLVFSAVMVLIVLGGDGYFHSRPRFLLPAFGLLLPPVLLALRLRERTAAAVMTAAAVASALSGCYLIAHSGSAVL